MLHIFSCFICLSFSLARWILPATLAVLKCVRFRGPAKRLTAIIYCAFFYININFVFCFRFSFALIINIFLYLSKLNLLRKMQMQRGAEQPVQYIVQLA